MLLALLYVMFSLPKSFVLSHTIFKRFNIPITFDNNPGVPTTFGLLIHALIFLVIVYGILVTKVPKEEKRGIHIERPDEGIQKIEKLE